MKRLPRLARIAVVTVLSFIVLIALLWVGVGLYAKSHKASILKNISEQLNENLNGKLEIADMEFELLRGFPGVSLSLRHVLLRDSLYNQHHKDLLKAEYVYVAVNAFSIIRGAPRIRDIRVKNATVNLITDSNGYSNTSVFKPRNDASGKDTTEEKGKPKINHLIFENVRVAITNDVKAKSFLFAVRHLNTELFYEGKGWHGTVDVDAQIEDLSFNRQKGSFAKGKTLTGSFGLEYFDAESRLNIAKKEIEIGSDAVSIGGNFYFKGDASPFNLSITASDIFYTNALSLVSSSIASKLKTVDFAKPVSMTASIQGLMKYHDTPLVVVKWNIKDNQLITPGGTIDHVSFSGSFSNELDPSRGHNDPNSVIRIANLKGSYSGIPFTAEQIAISNLIYPVIQGRFRSRFNLKDINEVAGAETFHFTGGDAMLDLNYKAGLREEDTTIPNINGVVQVRNAAFTYTPRSPPISGSNIRLRFSGSDLFVENGTIQMKHSSLSFSGAVRNFLYLYYRAPEQIVLDWSMQSSLINMDEFLPFLEARKTSGTGPRPASAPATGSKARSAKAARQSQRLDEVLDKSVVRLRASIDKLVYKKFTATRIAALATLGQNEINISGAKVQVGRGTLELNARLRQNGKSNEMQANAKVRNVEVQPFFASFDNFGQDAITDKNLRGALDADVNIAALLTSAGGIKPGSMAGEISFNLSDGALVHFEPFEKIGRYVFRKRNLSEVTFKDISNKLVLANQKITIDPMEIESSAINMFIEGVYSLNGGTEIFVDVPLRNPKKDELVLDDSTRLERSTKGIVVHLKAVDGDDGKVKIAVTRKGKH